MSKCIDLTGQKFGRLTVIKRAENKSGQTMWLCRCECGNERFVCGGNLKSGHTKSCGCLNNEMIGNLNKTHHKYNTRLHGIWAAMKSRCYNPKNNRFKNYGGKGIEVCEDWQSFKPFYDWAMANGYREDLTLDRKDGNKNYCPENCRWATQEEQQNNRSNNHLITYNGETHTLAQWAKLKNINSATLAARLKKGWSTEKAMTKF